MLGRESHLVPDMHPVAVLAVDALPTDLDLDLGNHLLANVVEPAGVDSATARRAQHVLVDFRERDLEIGAVAKVAVSTDGARDSASEIGLT